MPSILAMDCQVAMQLEIRVVDVVMQVGFTERKEVRIVLENASRSAKFPLKPLTLV